MVVEYKSIIKNDVWEMVLRLIAKLVSFTKLSMHMMGVFKSLYTTLFLDGSQFSEIIIIIII